MKNPLDVDKLIQSIWSYPYVEDMIDDRQKKISGVGILLGYVPKHITTRIWRSYRKIGKLFFFEEVEIQELADLRKYAYMFVSRIGDNYIERLYNGAKIGVLRFESNNSFRLKRMFKPWWPYRGMICRGKICRRINWMMYVPTYSSGNYLFLCDFEDLVRSSFSGFEYPIQDLLFAYNVKKPMSLVRLATLPLFRYY
ncbi:MAG: hypothetical protein QW456_07640 [Ignisphaera sp.]